MFSTSDGGATTEHSSYLYASHSGKVTATFVLRDLAM